MSINNTGAAFESVRFEYDPSYSDFSSQIPTGQAQRGLWEVNDNIHEKPMARFHRGSSSFVEMIYESGSGPVLSGAPLPEGLLRFVTQKFLPHLNVAGSKHSPLVAVLDVCFRNLDYQEPYFFLVDMPVALCHDVLDDSYRVKKTGTILNPENIELFRVQRGWNFPHYNYVHKLITDPRTQALSRGEAVMGAKGQPMTDFDIMAPVAKAVYGDWQYFSGTIEEWMENYFENLIYDTRYTGGVEDADELRSAQEFDRPYWMAVALGLMTWLKSPHGLRYLIHYHPIYYDLLTWDEDRQTVVITPGTDGWGIVDGWTIYTGKDVEVIAGVPPGTCCVSQQNLHCTERVNVKAVMTVCACGEPRNMSYEDYYYDRDHNSPACREWENANPPQMVYVSYAALSNILNKRDPKTPCERTVCPNTRCMYHMGHWARVQALTQRRTKMLTHSSGH